MKTFSAVAVASVAICFPASASAGACEYAKTTYTKLATVAAGFGVATGVSLKAAGVISIAHSSGAAIAATTSGGYLAGTLGVGGAAVGVLTAPATMIVGGTAVVAAGGTIAYCRYASNKLAPARVGLRPSESSKR
jgi:hypothetical protein